MNRGEVWWADLPAPVGHRPVLLLTRHAAYRFLTSFIAAVVTRSIRKVPTHVVVGPDEGLPHVSAINLDNLETVKMAMLASRICELSPAKMAEVDDALRFSLGLD